MQTKQCSLMHRTDAIKLRNYGRIIQDLVAYATNLQDMAKRHEATIFIARGMRQKNLLWNKDLESGIERLREDIEILSDGRLDTSFPEFEKALARTASADAERKQSGKKKNAKK